MPEQNGNNRRKRSFLVIYAASLLAIALVLILLSYLQQQRANEQIDDLREQHDSFSVSALQSIDDLRAAIVALESENGRLETKIASLETAREGLASLNESLSEEVEGLESQLASLERRKSELERYFAADGSDYASLMWRVTALTGERAYDEAAALAAEHHAAFAELFGGSAEDSLYGEYLEALDTLDSRGAVELLLDENDVITGVSLPASEE